jgi:hypothetical protein
MPSAIPAVFWVMPSAIPAVFWVLPSAIPEAEWDGRMGGKTPVLLCNFRRRGVPNDAPVLHLCIPTRGVGPWGCSKHNNSEWQGQRLAVLHVIDRSSDIKFYLNSIDRYGGGDALCRRAPRKASHRPWLEGHLRIHVSRRVAVARFPIRLRRCQLRLRYE